MNSRGVRPDSEHKEDLAVDAVRTAHLKKRPGGIRQKDASPASEGDSRTFEMMPGRDRFSTAE